MLLDDDKTAKCSMELTTILSKLLKSKLVASVAELVKTISSELAFIIEAMFSRELSIIFFPFLPKA